jgi:hypothetical protein
VRAAQVLTGDAEPPVGGRPERVDDRVVAGAQLLARDVRTELDAAEVAEVGHRGDLVVDARDALDLRVVRGDAGAHEPVRRGQAVEQVDREACLEQLVGRVEPGRARSDNGDSATHLDDVRVGQWCG